MKATVETRKGIEVICGARVVLNADFTVKAGGVGRLMSVRGNIATVSFAVPKLPRFCEKCGKVSGLTFNPSIGQVECFITGCGHEQGFQNISAKLPFSSLRQKR